MTYSQGLGQMGRGASELLSPGGYDKFTSPAIGGSGMQLATSIGLPAYSAMQPKPIDTTEEEARRKAEANKYVDPITGKLNPYQSSPNFGTMLMATGGTVNTNSSSISSGGIQDLYGTNDQTTGTRNISQDGYGIGRLNSLAAEGSKAKAADTFYAAGGPIAFAEGGVFEFEKTKEDQNVSAEDDGLSFDDKLISDLGNSLSKLLKTSPWKAGTFAVSNDGGKTGMTTKAFDQFSPLQKAMMGVTYMDSPQWQREQTMTSPTSTPTALNVNSGKQEPLAKGGYLDGAGDGMSDSIPGTIEGKQPARLADGEFVVPADVVSHLGNGSSKAGAKNLYAMMNKVRKARTGNSKQGKQINPNKYMPA
jgi:hypothetical protein